MHASTDDQRDPASALATHERGLRLAIDTALTRGWRLDDLEHALVRLVRGRARDLARHLRGGLDEWRRARRLSDEEAIAAARVVQARITALPTVPPVTAASAGGGDDGVLDKVRALLAKAESTSFPAEADALSAKAQQLMSRHAIDRALLDGRAVDGEVQVRRVLIEDPYAKAKVLLLSCVARSCRCEVVWSSTFGFATVFGFGAELDAVDVLYTSLLLQSTRAMVATPLHPGLPAARVGAFRRAFLYAFAHRVGERLRESADTVLAEATADHGNALLPVLASRAAAVEAAVNEYASRGRPRSISTTDASGWVAGAAAGDRATITQRPRLPDAPRALSGGGGSRRSR